VVRLIFLKTLPLDGGGPGGGDDGQFEHLPNMKKHPSEGAYQRARALRQRMTDAERRFWQIVRGQQIDGLRFRRQVPIGRYIVDFACQEARLIIEIDGGQHDAASPDEFERSRFLAGQGYRMLRFWSNEVLQNPEGVLTSIALALRHHHPHPTLPHQGGGFERAG
jgi:very-short-patch-repair endonuclease